MYLVFNWMLATALITCQKVWEITDKYGEVKDLTLLVNSSNMTTSTLVDYCVDEISLSHFLPWLESEEKETRIMYSGAVIRMAAMAVQALKKYKNILQIQRLQFTNKWIQRLLTSHGLRRRALTKEAKPRPSDDEIRRAMEAGQELLRRGSYPPRCVWNLDETPLRHMIGPTHLYMPRPGRARARKKQTIFSSFEACKV